jgi:thiol-disulfide isomerase/thioredoxin
MIKNKLFRKSVLTVLSLVIFSSVFGQYKITIKLTDLTNCDKKLMLANHFGDKQYIRDSSDCINGNFVFQGDEKLENGVYLVVLPEKNYFEFVVSENEDQTKYFFTADTKTSRDAMSAKGSKENKIFFEFNNYTASFNDQLRGFYQITKDENASEEAKKEAQDSMNAIKLKIYDFRREIANKNQGTFVSKLFNAMTDIAKVEAPEGMSDSAKSRYLFYYYKDNFWNNVDLGESGLVRSPVYHGKLTGYFEQFMPPVPDTAIAMADKLLDEIEEKGGKELYKYTIHHLLKYFQEKKYMCFDKAAYHMAHNYYCLGKAFWADSGTVAKMCEDAGKMKATLCDKIAPNVVVPDTTFSRRLSLHNIRRPVTILIFWDIDCGHCKKEMPIISKFYDSCDKNDVEIFAVYTRDNWEGWKKFIRDNDLKFINCGNAFGEDNFRKNYNITSTPQIYVLDKDKKIIFKKVAAENLHTLVDYMLKQHNKENSPSKAN